MHHMFFIHHSIDGYLSCCHVLSLMSPTLVQFNSVQQLNCTPATLCTPWNTAHQASLSITSSQSLPNSCPSSWWCHPTISSSVILFFSCLKSFPASGSFSVRQFFASGDFKYWSFSFSISPSNEYSGLISFRMDWLRSRYSPRDSRVFSKTTVQKHQFFSTQLSL